MVLLRLTFKLFRIMLFLVLILCFYQIFRQVSLPQKKTRDYMDTQDQRKENILTECRKSKFSHRNSEKISGSMQVVRKHSILYCAIAKVGCTFLKRLMLVLSATPGKYSSPFDISPGDAHFRYIETLSKIPEPLRDFMKYNYTKFFFVRNPYTRLFSGYVDKFFTPQTPFHQNYGRYIIETFRKNASANSLKCGHDVNFLEFVQYVMTSIKAGVRQNPHFMPMYLQCDPCIQSYDIVGRLETFKEDLRLILPREQWQLHVPKNIRELSQIDEVRDAVDIAFNNRKAQKGCLTFHQILERIWRRLQIRGLLSRHIEFPISVQHSASLTRETFKQILNMALLKSWHDLSTKQNRNDAMLEAFNTLPRQDLQELSNILQIDCRMFGYDTKPANIFNPKDSGNQDFRFFDLLPS